jgi:HK97 family phage major capsid protein
MNIEKRLAEIRERTKEIRGLIETDDKANLDELEKELRDLTTERDDLERRQEMTRKLNSGEVTPNPAAVVNPLTTRAAEPDAEKVYRSAWLKSLMGRSLDDTEKRAIDKSKVAGAVPTQTASEIIRKLKQIVPLLNEVTLLHVPGNVTFAVEGVKNPAALHAENTDITAADDTLVSVSLAGYEIVKLIRISATVRAMTINSFETWLVDMLTEALAEKIEDYLVNGTGSSNPQGLASNTWTSGDNYQPWAGASLAVADVSTAIGLLPGAYDRNAKFLMAKKTLWANVMSLRDDGKAPIVKDDGRGGYMIYGYSVMLSDAVATGVIYLGDYKKIVANLAEGMNVKSSEHSGFTANAIDYRGTCIFDSKLAVAEAFVKIAKAAG